MVIANSYPMHTHGIIVKYWLSTTPPPPFPHPGLMDNNILHIIYLKHSTDEVKIRIKTQDSIFYQFVIHSELLEISPWRNLLVVS